MGFASELQGKTSHEALINLQDAELRLLENMRRCIQLRVKCDREYAVGLSSLSLLGQKVEENHELSGSQIGEAWNSILSEAETWSNLIQQNADHLGSHTLDCVNSLILEKRALRKHFTEEYGRLHGELIKFQDGVGKTKVEYEKCLESFKTAKAKFEDLYIRGKVQKKLEESRERLLKVSRKLHRMHNEYVLLIKEARIYEENFREKLIPHLMNFQESVLQESAASWKELLKDYCKFTDLTGEKFQAIQKKMVDSIDAVAVSEEYKVFVQKNRSQPGNGVQFEFDQSLLDEYSGKLEPNQLIMDSFTYDVLRDRAEDLDNKLSNCRAEMKNKNFQLEQYVRDMNALKNSPDEIELIKIKQRAIDIVNKEIEEMQCHESRWQQLFDLINSRFGAIGPEGPATALDLGENIHSDQVSEEPFAFNTLSKKAARSLVEKLKSPFFRKPLVSTDPPCPPAKDFMENHCGSFNFHDTSAGVDTKRAKENPGYRSLQDEDWFHGVLPREEVVRLLRNDGDFLVRETTRNEERQIVLSICWQGHKHFIIQTTVEGGYRFEGPVFATIRELIQYQHHSGLPVTAKSGAVLKTPVSRERWELNNDDIDLIEKIGRGNFGDVYKGKLRITGQDVAVKTCRVNLPEEQKKKFLLEGRILKQYNHPNIVKFIGICVQKQPIMIVMELVPGGSLLNFLRNHGSSLLLNDLLAMCIDTAAGMEYLENQNCIHRDLAARNCLIGDNNVVKISDFGMSREEEEYIVSDGMKQIPIKWTAPEALNFGRYTSLCDVWSYGILMWEILSLGSTPYCGLSNSRARELIDSGYRLPAPDNTPDCVYELMLRTWEYNPERRPLFSEIRRTLESISKTLG